MKNSAHSLDEIVKYDPSTGVFVNLLKRSRLGVGDVLGNNNSRGYSSIMINGKSYLAHRLAWFLMKGAWPEGLIDHINQNRSDNRWANLRQASYSQNGMNRNEPANNTSGRKGVCWHKREQKWFAYIMIKQKQKSLGYFTDLDVAIQARKQAESEVFAEFNPTGKNA